MRVGISIITHEGQSIWANGLAQNVFILGQLFRSLPFVEDVVLLNSGDQSAFSADAGPGAAAFPLVPVREATDMVDVVIEMSGGLDVEWLDLMRARGAKVIFHVCGHPYVSLLEPTMFNTTGYCARFDRCDELWVLEQYTPFAPMLAALHRCPAHIVPLIWAPDFIATRVAELEALGMRFGVREDDAGWAADGLRAAIFEPNIAVTKTSVISLLICEEAQRRDPTAIARLTALNTAHLVGQPTFDFLKNSLDLSGAGKIVIEGRHDFAGFMSQHGDAVISHQWRHQTNYLYCDALYGDYPLIHNSDWASSAGYFFPGFDVQEGARQLLAARAGHFAGLADYHTRSRRFLARLDPLHHDNRDLYARRLLSLVPGPRGRGR
jgi:Protein of unknown function (DUF2827)